MEVATTTICQGYMSASEGIMAVILGTFVLLTICGFIAWQLKN